MRDFIKQKLVEHHAKCSVDKYGQRSALDFYQIFGSDGDSVLKYLSNEAGVLRICTYGGRYGTYKGISDILDANIKAECSKAFSSNPNYRRAMTSW
jgi:hypothetical protein